jgi:hypothetical protein
MAIKTFKLHDKIHLKPANLTIPVNGRSENPAEPRIGQFNSKEILKNKILVKFLAGRQPNATPTV